MASLNSEDRNNNVESITIPPGTLIHNMNDTSSPYSANITININVHRLETKKQVGEDIAFQLKAFSLVMTGSFDTENQPIVYSDAAFSSSINKLVFSIAIMLCIILIV